MTGLGSMENMADISQLQVLQTMSQRIL